MSTQTPNLGLVKPAGGERPLVSDLNGNMDKLDAAVGAVDAAQDGSLQAQVTAVKGSLSSLRIISASSTETVNAQSYKTFVFTFSGVGSSKCLGIVGFEVDMRYFPVSYVRNTSNTEAVLVTYNSGGSAASTTATVWGLFID